MREILFRGKQRDNGEWVEGGIVQGVLHELWHNSDRAYITVFPQYLSNLKLVEVDHSTAGQYTGLTDKNGKRIFEGDIVRCISMTDMANMVVIFEDGEFRMVLCEKYKDYIPGCGFYAIRCFDKEIIGNIHDNPELLENP